VLGVRAVFSACYGTASGICINAVEDRESRSPAISGDGSVLIWAR